MGEGQGAFFLEGEVGEPLLGGCKAAGVHGFYKLMSSTTLLSENYAVQARLMTSSPTLPAIST